MAVTVNPAATTTSLSSSNVAPAVGQTVTFTATVAPVAPGAGIADGHGRLLRRIGPHRHSSGRGRAVCDRDAFSEAGQTHTITATYLASGSFQTSVSAGQTETVVQANP